MLFCHFKFVLYVVVCFFFQAEDGIRDAQESRGLGDVYKRQVSYQLYFDYSISDWKQQIKYFEKTYSFVQVVLLLSLIHI